jgi:hypothetical protein
MILEGNYITSGYPKKALKFIIQKNLKPNLFTHSNWSDFFLWFTYPKYRSFVDGRIEFFQKNKIIEKYNNFFTSFSENKLLSKKYDINTVVVLNKSEYTLFFKKCGWSLIYEDNLSAIFQKNN